MAAAYIKWLRDVNFASQSGCPPNLAPNYGHHRPPPDSSRGEDIATPIPTCHTPPAWAAAFVLVWDWTWRTYDDRGLATEHYDHARAYLDSIYPTVDDTTGVVPAHWSTLGDWCAALGVNGTGGDCRSTTGRDPGNLGDPSTCFETKHVTGIQNTFYFVRTHEAWLRAHAALGRPEAEAVVYRQRLAAARNGFNSVFFDNVCSYVDGAITENLTTYKRYGLASLQTSLALALEMGVTKTAASGSDATAAVQAALRYDVEETMGGRMSTGLIGTRYLLGALSDAGGVDTAIGLLTNKQDPSWTYMLDQGPGTLWEQFLGNKSWARARGSLNHVSLYHGIYNSALPLCA